MSDMEYFDNIKRIQEIISQLETGSLSPQEAEELYETAKELIEKCQSTLNGYSGKLEEINCVSPSQ